MTEKRWKELPGGVWLYFKNLPATTTDESLSAYFNERGLAIGPESISVTAFGADVRRPFAGAMVSVGHDVVLDMMRWVLNGDKIEGREPRPEVARCSAKLAR
jgi:hypothetical protein